jgi:glycolate oxidase
MNRILEVDPGNMCAVVQPGVINMDLQKRAAPLGLMYGPDPASMFVSTIGGNVALNAGGPRAVKYGVTRDALMGLELVLSDGEVIRTGGKTVKNVTGYDLTRLLCGSEGTLGIITEITVKLVPMPPAKGAMLTSFPSLRNAAETVSAIMAAGITPGALELMEKTVIDLIKDYSQVTFPEGTEAVLLVEVDGEPSSIEGMVEKIKSICQEKNALRIDIAKTPQEAERLWQARRVAGPALYNARPTVFSEDATVPVKNLPDIITKIGELKEKHQVKVAVFAHAGDGNLHPCIMTDARDREEMARVDRFVREFFEVTIAMGGTLTGEHGIGIAKDQYMNMEYSKRAIEIMKGIKRVFDPDNILNPGSFL